MSHSEVHPFDEFLEVYEGVYGAMPEPVKRLMFELCQTHGDRAVEALLTHIQDPTEGVYRPKPAHLNRILGVRSVTHVPHNPAAFAWDLVMACIEMVGSHVDVAFEDPVIHTVIPLATDQEGLSRYGTMLDGSEALSFARTRFIETYNSVAGTTIHHPAFVRGWCPRADGGINLVGNVLKAAEHYRRLGGTSQIFCWKNRALPAEAFKVLSAPDTARLISN